MAEETVDSDYSGKPIQRRPVTDEDRRRKYTPDDAIITLLDGRYVWVDMLGTFELDGDLPDRSRPVEHRWPTIEDLIAAGS